MGGARERWQSLVCCRGYPQARRAQALSARTTTHCDRGAAAQTLGKRKPPPGAVIPSSQDPLRLSRDRGCDPWEPGGEAEGGISAAVEGVSPSLSQAAPRAWFWNIPFLRTGPGQG